MPATPRSPWRHLPNAISLLRMVLALPIGWAILAMQPRMALGLIAVAGISDGLDGFIARRYHWQSRLGGILDALADKLLLVACFLLLAWVGMAPWWLALLVCGRDVVIVAGALAWRLFIGPIRPEPSSLSKACTLLQIVYLLAVLVAASGWPSPPLAPLAMLAAVLCIASGLDYVLRWSRRAWVTWHARDPDSPR
ncbi:CDP-alcohol phosphatidyltransferase family protein [Dyella subtropica]|uniref:CDP-alcohol phosphatidyltransferase family protein n=1 Tax=Dyella subtropica TaxID=2992127 RepID=UPI002254FB5A|nr:CDP-alcohol phosphatidyltransferase family protein [Dyella subtropica]